MDFARVSELVREMARGRMVIVVDGPDRENEGDFVMAAGRATPDTVRLMATQGRGLICAPIAPSIADRLALWPMTETPTDPEECAFTISVDARRGTTTGISAFDRATTARLLADPTAQPNDFKRPGHLFPLRAKQGGVLERPGHTEAAVDLATLAELEPAGLVCEIMNDDGTMARLPDLVALARREGLLLGRIDEIIAHRQQTAASPRRPGSPSSVRFRSAAKLPTPFGVFEIHVFENAREEEVVALTLGSPASPATEAHESEDTETAPVARIHSACFTGDVLGSLRCDCGGQLQLALRRIGEEGRGILVYLPQEGRGIGLARKIEAYRLQERGLDTVQANLRLGFPADLRGYEDGAAVLRWFGIQEVRLLTNNPSKISGLAAHGVRVRDRLPLEAGPGPVNHAYLKAKKGKLGHLFEAV